MKQSGIASRMSSNQQRFSQPAKLNLVSLMDIFTILVFFLLVNSGDNQLVQNNNDNLVLPASTSSEQPEETLVVAVSKTDIVVGGRPVAMLSDIQDGDGIIAALAEELKYQAGRKTQLSEKEKAQGLAVTVMGDEDLEYDILKRVMATCADANYRDLSLAVAKSSSKKKEA